MAYRAPEGRYYEAFSTKNDGYYWVLHSMNFTSTVLRVLFQTWPLVCSAHVNVWVVFAPKRSPRGPSPVWSIPVFGANCAPFLLCTPFSHIFAHFALILAYKFVHTLRAAGFYVISSLFWVRPYFVNNFGHKGLQIGPQFMVPVRRKIPFPTQERINQTGGENRHRNAGVPLFCLSHLFQFQGPLSVCVMLIDFPTPFIIVL